MQLKQYQEDAIKELLEKAKRLLGYLGEKKLVFKAPTGSGKTIMMAEFLKQLVDDREVKQELAFIWAAPRQLHEQSRQKLEDYFEESRALKCSSFNDLDDRKIGENEILFFNWESINRVDNIYIRDNEQDFNLSKVLERTREEGRAIVLVIDEAHHHATSEISQRLIRDIDPKLTIEVSATPVITDEDEKVNVQLEEVKKDGVIKKAVMLNDGFVSLIKKQKITTDLSGGTEDKVLNAAMKKRDELRVAFKKEGVEINPLVLIQLPDRHGQLEDTIRERIEKILKDKYKISTEKGNNKLAIWLSGEHINKEDVEKNDSEVEVLIFKQAIALGWDCPRAQILVLFRQWHSPIFSVQTVGRIMRMPEPDKGHYGNEVLNYGYVYTNLDHIEIREDLARSYITIYTSKRRKDYQDIDLLSCHSVRHREATRLSPLFIATFLDEAAKFGLQKKIDPKSKKLDIKIFSDWKADNIDVLAGKELVADKKIGATPGDMQKIFDYFIRDSLRPLYPEDRSVGRLKEAIYRFFEQAFKMRYGEDEDQEIQIALSEQNRKQFKVVIEKAKERYKKDVVKREPELAFDEKWNVPATLPFGEDDQREEYKLSIMQPFYRKGEWRSEKAFVEYLEDSDNVEWWFKNGDRDATFFAVPYEDGDRKPFYVDFIVKMKDGRIGLFDPHGLHLSDFATKSDGLRKYIQEQNKKGKKLFGGIVANTDTRNYKGHWIYFDKSSKEFEKDSFHNWMDIEL